MIRRVCVLGALLALILQGSTGGHMLLVEHSRCAEHGELVHQAEARAHAPRPARLDAAAIRTAPDPSTKDAHEHCSLSANRRDGLSPWAKPLQSALQVEAKLTLPMHDPLLVAGRARFRIAPKNSPPA